MNLDATFSSHVAENTRSCDLGMSAILLAFICINQARLTAPVLEQCVMRCWDLGGTETQLRLALLDINSSGTTNHTDHKKVSIAEGSEAILPQHDWHFDPDGLHAVDNVIAPLLQNLLWENLVPKSFASLSSPPPTRPLRLRQR